jgi:hypothetical protein
LLCCRVLQVLCDEIRIFHVEVVPHISVLVLIYQAASSGPFNYGKY